MNYRHIYHAGNFADVAKHTALQYCLEALKRKDAAFFAMDTHAGRGSYDLRAAESKKSGEAERGIQRVIGHVLRENRKMLHLADRLGFKRQAGAAGGNDVSVVKFLGEL